MCLSSLVLSILTFAAVLSVLHNAGNGIERWIRPGLEYTLASDSVRKNYPKTHKVLSEILDAAQDLPVAKQWMRQCREWAEPGQTRRVYISGPG